MGRMGVEGTAKAMRDEGGFTLIEVMFATVYLAVGLLGIAAMQDIALSRGVDAKRLSLATNVAAEMLERIRFNSPANATSGAGGFPYHNIRACGNPANATYCPGGESAGNTTGNPTANGDYDQWRGRLRATDPNGALMLPDAVGTVTSATTGTSSLSQVQVTVTLTWTAGIRRPTVSYSTIVAPL